MGIYYSSVGTRLDNYLRHEGLTIEDFAVLEPRFVFYIRNLGKKSLQAIYERLEELGMEPGKYAGQPDMYPYEVLRYYKENRTEIRKENPIVYINKEPEKPKDDWEEYRKRIAEEVLLKLVGIGAYGEFPDPKGYTTYHQFVPAYTPEEAAEYAVKAADELIKLLKEIH